MTRSILVRVVAALVASGCGAANSSAPTMTAPSRSTTRPTAPSSGPILSGAVLATTRGGTVRLDGGQVVYLAGERSGAVVVGPDGRYEITGLHSGERVRVTALPPPGSGLFQRSATSVTLGEQTVLDIELVEGDERGATFGSPTLSGRVYYVAADGPRPWPHTRVVYKSVQGPWYDVYQTSDDDGRFTFGRLPLGSGQLGAGDCNDQLEFRPVEIRGETVADVDVTGLIGACPGVPR